MYLFVCLEGIKVVSADDGCIEMVHVLQNITKCSVIRGHSIFGFVARDPIKCQREFCHVFQMAEEIHARRTHAILSHAFHLMSRLYNEGIQHGMVFSFAFVCVNTHRQIVTSTVFDKICL